MFAILNENNEVIGYSSGYQDGYIEITTEQYQEMSGTEGVWKYLEGEFINFPPRYFVVLNDKQEILSIISEPVDLAIEITKDVYQTIVQNPGVWYLEGDIFKWKPFPVQMYATLNEFNEVVGYNTDSGYVLEEEQYHHMLDNQGLWKLEDGIFNRYDFPKIPETEKEKEQRLQMERLQRKNKALEKIVEMQAILLAETMDNETLLEVQDIFPEWDEFVELELDPARHPLIMYKGELYTVLSKHTVQETWTPTAAPSLFAKKLTAPDGTPKEWVQPDSTNPYMKGDKVTFEGKIYESAIDNNIWSPAAYAAGWKEIPLA